MFQYPKRNFDQRGNTLEDVWNLTYPFFEEWPRELEHLLPIVSDHEMFGGRTIFACHFLNEFDMFDATIEILIKFWMKGR